MELVFDNGHATVLVSHTKIRISGVDAEVTMLWCNNTECIFCLDGKCSTDVVDQERRNEEPEVLMCNTFQEWQA